MALKHGGGGVVEALPKGLFSDPAFKAKVCAKAGAALPACAAAPAPR
jgi:hypothetical protein